MSAKYAKIERGSSSMTVFMEAVSGIPGVYNHVIGRQVCEMDAEVLSGQLASGITLPESVDHTAAANTVLAMLRQPWSETPPEVRALMTNVTQRILDEMGLKVVRKDD